MVITVNPPLPCVHLVECPESRRGYTYCGHAATLGMVSRVEDDAWELLPLCGEHARELPGDARCTSRLQDKEFGR
jgi:hypothetical protein